MKVRREISLPEEYQLELFDEREERHLSRAIALAFGIKRQNVNSIRNDKVEKRHRVCYEVFQQEVGRYPLKLSIYMQTWNFRGLPAIAASLAYFLRTEVLFGQLTGDSEICYMHADPYGALYVKEEMNLPGKPEITGLTRIPVPSQSEYLLEYERILKRPGLYLGDADITAFQHYLDGMFYGFNLMMINLGFEKYTYYAERDFAGFETWLQRRLRMPDYCSIYPVLLQRASGESEAMEQLRVEFQQYLKEIEKLHKLVGRKR